MVSHPGPVFALALVAVLSGCAGLGGPNTPTITPAPVPEVTPEPTAVPAVAPGVSANGISDAGMLAQAHVSLLQRNSYTASVERTIRGPDGRLRQHRVEAMRVGEDGDIYRKIEFRPTERDSRVSTIETWRNGTRAVFAFTTQNETRYADESTAAFKRRFLRVHAPVPQSQRLFIPLRSIDIDSVEPAANGTYAIRGEAVTIPSLLEGMVPGRNVRNVTFRATITTAGLIEAYELRYEADRRGETIRVVKRLRNREIGTTTVERPPWYENATAVSEV